MIYPWDLHFNIEIVWGIKDSKGKVYFKERRFGRVVKSNFWGIDSTRGLNFAKPYLFDVSYDGVVAELLKPWGDGVKVGKELDVCVEQAKEWVLEH